MIQQRTIVLQGEQKNIDRKSKTKPFFVNESSPFGIDIKTTVFLNAIRNYEIEGHLLETLDNSKKSQKTYKFPELRKHCIFSLKRFFFRFLTCKKVLEMKLFQRNFCLMKIFIQGKNKLKKTC